MGRLVPDKQFDLLIDVYAELAPRFPDWNLRIWGEGPQRAALESQVARLGLQARIRLPGRTETPWKPWRRGRPSCSVRRSRISERAARSDGTGPALRGVRLPQRSARNDA